MVDMSAWEVLGVPKEVQRGLSEQSFTTPTPMKNFFFFFLESERERKKIIFQHVRVSTMMYT